jgi:FKBP-type peptidyl-prolyl cis-trans isomerase
MRRSFLAATILISAGAIGFLAVGWAATRPAQSRVLGESTGYVSRSREPKVVPPSGPAPTKLVIRDLIKGKGRVAKHGERAIVMYVGVLYHGGKAFDSTWKRDESFTFSLGSGEVIKGWEQGVVGMRVGGRRELIIPARLAYGKQGEPQVIPPNETLVFVIDLIRVAQGSRR